MVKKIIKKTIKKTTNPKVVKRGKLKKNASPFAKIYFEKDKVFKVKVKSDGVKRKKRNTTLKNKKNILKIKTDDSQVKLTRLFGNPVISPSGYSWESVATFNPTAINIDGTIYVIYRAIGDGDISVLGCAKSHDGINIKDRYTYCVYKRIFDYIKSGKKINYLSGGGGFGGTEDPRIVLIDGTIYMTYTAFDGWNSIRIALTSIKADDFKKGKWNWKKSVFISPPGEIHKNWVIFPEKINGKFAILHSISPEILIDYFDSLDEFDGNKFIKSNYHNKPKWGKENDWDNYIRGVGPAPIKTHIGWLVLYHAMDKKDFHKYKIGAMILDLKDPTKILHKSKSPILEPEEDYEKEGYRGIVYTCGAIIKNGKLIVYYGSGDKHVSVAYIELKELLESLTNNKKINLKNNYVRSKKK